MHKLGGRSPFAALRRLRSPIALSPVWALLIGVAALVVGGILLTRPFASLFVLLVVIAVALILTAFTPRRPAGNRTSRVVSIVARVVSAVSGIAVLLLPAITIDILVILLVVALVVTGVARLIEAVMGTGEGRLPTAVTGAASIVLGLLAAAWPDLSVVALAAIVGVQLLVFGVEQIAAAVRTIKPARPALHRRGERRRSRLWRGIAASVVLALAVGGAAATARWGGSPVPDAFYTAPDGAATHPGALLRTEPFDIDVPPGAHGWRILYATTDHDDAPTLASAIVVVPDDVTSPPVIAWAHGTTGTARGCAPSLLAHPFVAGAMPDLAATLQQGWAVVATDYAGLGTAGPHGYLVGQQAGRSVLDAVRAAGQLTDVDLTGPTTIWGHSQGGHAALWAGGLAATYAPDLDIVGVAALAPAADLAALSGGLASTSIGGVFGAFMVSSYGDIYPDVRTRDHIRPGARILVEEMAKRCLTDPSTLVSVATVLLADGPVFAGDPARGPLLQRAVENTPTLPVSAPLLIAQGDADTVVLPEVQRRYVDRLCTAGQEVEYRTYDGFDHMGVIGASSPLPDDLRRWTAERIAGEASAARC